MLDNSNKNDTKLRPTLRLAVTEVGKFGLSIGQLTYLTNRQSEFTSHSHESRARKKFQCKRTFTRRNIQHKGINTAKYDCGKNQNFLPL